ncbi:hypothetical protein ACFYKX_06005 [Cytobacillus sp. FJAT-54145]|uniref:Chemotaxis protein CheX n=1 Tax=Cytobacillus spartinae TaxID=3299023 RepID=A0ABW6K7H6_9BACI
MFSQYFGHYLLNRGLITKEQLTDALEFQQSVHVKFGVIAVDEGYMTAVQVDEVHEKQKQVDKRFGEIAVELGYLTNDQVDDMLSSQKQNHLLLAQALVDREYMTIDAFSKALNDYKKDYSLTDDKFEAIKSGDIDALVETLLDGKASTSKDFYKEYLSLFAKNLIRFVDDQVYLEFSGMNDGHLSDWYVYQEITGDSPLYTGVAANEDVFLYIASKYAEEDLAVVDELAQASVSEFLNLHNGIFLVNMSNKGIELNMKPQSVVNEVSTKGVNADFLVTVSISKGTFHLLLSEEPENVQIQLKESNQQLV